MSAEELKQRLNEAIAVLSDGVAKLEILAENKQLKETNEELAELAHDQAERITDLEAILIFHHIDPESQTACKSEVE
jgi:RecJ-like exonuclease